MGRDHHNPRPTAPADPGAVQPLHHTVIRLECLRLAALGPTGVGGSTAASIIATAKEFERYVRGDNADGVGDAGRSGSRPDAARAPAPSPEGRRD